MATLASDTASIAYDEHQCKLALAHLEKLQDQLQELRLTIPIMLQPLAIKHAASKPLFNDFREPMYGGPKGLSEFKAAWLDPKTQMILDHAKKSYLAQPDLSAGANVPLYGWVEEIERDEASDGTLADGFSTNNPPSEQRIEQIIEQFKTEHPMFTVDHNTSQHLIYIPALKAQFKISYNNDLEKGPMFVVECMGTSTLCSAITQCITSRPQPNNLKQLLEMIASYKDARTKECAKCGSLLDILHKSAMTPAGRRSKLVTTADGATTTTWQAYHEKCL